MHLTQPLPRTGMGYRLPERSGGRRRPDAGGPYARKVSGKGPTRTYVLGAPLAAKPDDAEGPAPSAQGWVWGASKSQE
jgi:hypothetical protein